TMATVLFLLACALRAAKNHRPGALITTLGSVLLTVAIAHDTLRFFHIVQSNFAWAAIGILAFVFAYGLVLGHRLFVAWDENIALNEQLIGLNRDLEAKVVTRTRNLARESARAVTATR